MVCLSLVILIDGYVTVILCIYLAKPTLIVDSGHYTASHLTNGIQGAPHSPSESAAQGKGNVLLRCGTRP